MQVLERRLPVILPHQEFFQPFLVDALQPMHDLMGSVKNNENLITRKQSLHRENDTAKIIRGFSVKEVCL